MARRQLFDAQSAVRRARDLFWDRGYAATTLTELEASTGLTRSQIRHTFGGKRGLYDAAVEDYLDTVVRPQLARMAAADDPRQAVLTYFGWLATHIGGQREVTGADSDAAIRGCLLVDSAAGIAAHDPHQRSVVAGFRSELAAALSGALSRANPGDGADAIARTARQLLALVVGALLLARVDPSEAIAMLATADDVIW